MSVNNGNDVYNEGGLTSADVKNIVDNLPEFQAKAEANKVVAIADASAYHSSQAGGKWYKVASKRVTTYLYNDNTIWDIYFSNSTNKQKGCLSLCVRFENVGTTPIKRTFSLHCDEWSADNNVKVVTRGVVGSVDIEIWVNANANYSSVMLVERNSSSYIASYTKGSWTYTNASGSGEYAPTTDAVNNVYVYDANIVLRQPAIFDNYPTKNSTSLVNSGKLYDVFTDDNGSEIVEAPPQQVYVTGKFYFVAGKVCRCTAYSAASATFDVYGVVEALNYVLSQT